MAILRLDRLGPGAAALLRALGAPPGAALVGGAIRDVVLRRTEADPSRDIDVAVPSGALELARRCAERLRGTCVVLDAERGAARVIADGGRTLDLTDFRGPSSRPISPRATSRSTRSPSRWGRWSPAAGRRSSIPP